MWLVALDIQALLDVAAHQRGKAEGSLTGRKRIEKDPHAAV
jgi:hypothetical protein